MRYPPKILLHSPIADPKALAPFVEKCLEDQVVVIASVGQGAGALDDLIDELVVGDGDDASRFVVTSWHEDETVQDVLLFLENWDGAVQEVKL